MHDVPIVMTNARDVRTFALAGNATLTLSSRRTGSRYTFKITTPHDKPAAPRRFVKVLTGPDNEANYTYLGVIDDCVSPQFRLTRKSRMGDDSAPVRAARFLCDRVLQNPDAPLPPDLEIRHEGRCGRCNRVLTVPESIDRGIGPDCAAKMNLN